MQQFFEQTQQMFNDEIAFWTARAEKSRATMTERLDGARATFTANLDEAVKLQRENIAELQAHFQGLAERQQKLYRDALSTLMPWAS